MEQIVDQDLNMHIEQEFFHFHPGATAIITDTAHQIALCCLDLPVFLHFGMKLVQNFMKPMEHSANKYLN